MKLPIQVCKIVVNAEVQDLSLRILSDSLIVNWSYLLNIIVIEFKEYILSYAAGVIPRRSIALEFSFSLNGNIATNC